MRDTRLSCFDICCGAGGLSHGFSLGGASILGGIDLNAHAIATVRRNDPRAVWLTTDIATFAQQVARDRSHVARRANVILAGLPCQGFSDAGRRDPADHRNRLYLHLIQIVRSVRPTYVVFENVRGMLSPRSAPLFNDFLSKMEGLGYIVAYRLLDLSLLGVPQRRRRLIMLATRTPYTTPDLVFEKLPVVSRPLTVRHALRGLSSTYERKRASHFFMRHSPAVTARLRTLKPRGPISYRRLRWDKPAFTVIGGHRALPVHPSQPRTISVREAARLQGFPDSYSFIAPPWRQAELVANAVPPQVGRALALALRRGGRLERAIHGKLYKRLQSALTEELQRTIGHAFARHFQAHGRVFAWRLLKDPFRILVTEILLQQTSAGSVRRVWKDVMRLVGTVDKACRADLRSLRAIIGQIGLPYRARTIRTIATYLALNHRGQVPQAFDDLLRIPGIGIYTAAAIRVFAFHEDDFPVDANAVRFVNRFFGLSIGTKKSETRQVREAFRNCFTSSRKETLYGFLDFAATICTARSPNCRVCPLATRCVYSSKIKVRA